ncbi:unnamed protein product [Orchesella dallaii]|uniref:THAP-type domain-containing protein n=1 Tax=Orchesella dallaii TaxID=48710 RepID=A0ABP1PR00_9HEXA
MGDPSIVKCFVPLCKATSENTRTVSFHQFPKSENLKAEWVQVLKDIEVYETMLADKGSDSISEWHICSRHFTSDDFEKTPNTSGQLKKSTSSNQETLVKRSLCYDAVPSVFAVTCMSKKKKLVNSIKTIQMKRKASFQGRLSGNGAPNPKKMKEKDDEKLISTPGNTTNNSKIIVTSSSPIANPKSNLQSKATTLNSSEISAKMENIVNKMELTTKPRPLPSCGRKPIPGVPDLVNTRMDNAVMQWLCLPQNIHAPYQPEPVPVSVKATSSNKLASKQAERRSPRAVVVSQSQPTHRVHISPKTSLANVAKRLVVSKSVPVVLPVSQRNIQKPTTSASVTAPPPSQVKHKPPKITVTNATKKPSKQNIQNAEPERKQPGTVHSMLTHAISKVFASPSKGRSKQNQKRPYYSQKQINTIDGLLSDNPPLIVATQNNRVKLGKSSSKKRHDKKKRKELKTNDVDSTSSDSDQSDNVEYVNGQVPWEAEDDEASETYDNDNLNSMEAEVPDDNIIDYDSYSNSIRLPNHSVLDMNTTNGVDDETNMQQDPLAILKYEVIEENEDADDANDPSNEYSTPLLNGFEFGMSEEDSTTILSAPAASCAVTAVLEAANSNNDIVDVGIVKVEGVKMEYLSDDENVESCAIVPETQIDGNNPGYSCAVTTTLTEGTIPDVKVKTEPELITS